MKSKIVLFKKPILLLLTYCIFQMHNANALPVTKSEQKNIKHAEVVELALPAKQYQQSKKIKIVKYNEELYKLAYKIYLQNNNIKDAYAVAAAAVLQQPQSKFWRLRFAEVALWNHDATSAVGQYLYLSKNFHDPRALKQGLKLAESMHDDAALVQLLPLTHPENKTQESFWNNYINAFLRLGDIDKAFEILEANKAKLSPSFYLLTSARIYRLISNPEAQLRFLIQYSNQFGMTSDVALQQAEIYLANNKIDEAYNALFLASLKARDNEFTFWKALATVASLKKNDQEEIHAYQKLLNKRKVDEEVYSRLVALITPMNQQIAYEYAKEGKKAYPKSLPLAISVFSLNLQTGKWKDFPKLEASTPKNIIQMLHYDLSYSEAKANYFQQIGLHDDAVKKYIEALRFLPANNYLKSDFIFFLIQTHDLPRLEKALSLWEKNASFTPGLWGTYTEGFSKINNIYMNRLFLQMYYDQFNVNKNDPYWLIVLKDILENSYLERDSWAVTHYTWPIYLDMLAKQVQPPDYNQILNYVKLSMQELPGDTTGLALTVLQKYPNADTELLMLTWALIHNNYELAESIYWNFQQRDILPPSWVGLTIALHRNDHYLMRDLLVSPREIVSYRDHVQAALDIDAVALAQTVAFDELGRHPADSNLYDNYFTPAMLKTADKVYLSQEYFQYSSAEGLRENLAYTYFLTPGISLTPHNSIWFSNKTGATSNTTNNSNSALSNALITNIPAYDERYGIKATITEHRGNFTFDIGGRNDLNSFLTAKIQRSYLAFQDLNTLFSFGYHQPAEDSLGLLVGGMKNDLHFDYNYRLSSKDTLFGEYDQNFFYTQGGQHVADGEQGALRYEHKFRLTYPDWTVSLYTTAATYFDKVKTLHGSILRIVPTGVPPTVSFLIPSDFYEYGITASFGQHYIEDYTHAWRPFALVNISNSSTVGLGKLFNVGVAGHLFGRDHLLLFYEQGTNQGQGVQLERLVKGSYSVYF